MTETPTALDPVTAAIVAWMRSRAEPVEGDDARCIAWREGVADMATEIEQNSWEGCGHAADTGAGP